MRTSQEMLRGMIARDREALLHVLEVAMSGVLSARAILLADEGPHDSPHHELRELLGAAEERIVSVLDRVRAADANVIMSAPSVTDVDRQR